MKKIFTEKTVRWILILLWYKDNKIMHELLVEEYCQNQEKFIEFLNWIFERSSNFLE